MSALEQALRQIDDQRQHPHKVQAMPAMMALPSEPLLVHTLLRWVPAALLLATVAAGGAGYWLYTQGGWQRAFAPRNVAPATGTPVPPPTSPASPQATTVQPVLTTGIPPAGVGTPLFERPATFDQAVVAWTSGQHAQAAQLWLAGLRRLPPSTMALLLAEHQAPEQVNNTVLARAAALPWLVVPGTSNGGPGWTVLVLTPSGDLDRTHAALAREGAALQWGTVAHWVARSEAPLPGTPLPSIASGPQPPATGGNTLPSGAVNTAQPPLVAPRPPASTTTVAPAPVVPAKPPTPAVAKPANAAAAAPSSAPAAPVAAAPTNEPPLLSRSPATDISAIASSSAPLAARAIENELASIEQDLSAARYDVALKRLGKLEENIGANWRTRYLTGVALSGLQRWREAVPMLTLARQGNTEHARVALYLSVAQQELGQHEAAIETLTKALVPHAGMPELWLNKAHSLQALGRGEEAAFHYRRFLDLSTNRQDLSQQRSWVQKLLDQKDSTW